MAITVKFKTGGVETAVGNDYIMKLHQTANMFSSSFRLGATVCRQFDLDIDKAAFSGGLNTNPDEVILYEGLTKYATLVIDSMDDTNDAYYSYCLTDRMVRLGDVDYRTWQILNGTFQQQIDSICSVYGLGTPPTLVEHFDVVLNWSGMTARDFVGYLAEISGAYAYINANNELVIDNFSTAAVDSIAVEDCSSFKVDNSITYDRVVYDTPSRVSKYPEDGNYTGTGATYYINPDNLLMTDDTVNTPPKISIDDIVYYVYNCINGLTFYNVEVEKCPIDDSVKCGDFIEFTLDGNTYPTIAQIDWDYNSMWLGGYKLALDNQLQEETTVTPLQLAARRITQYIDRELGEVGLRIDEVENGVSTNSAAIIANAQQITATVSQLIQDIPGIVADAGFVTQTQLTQTAAGITAQINTLQATEDGHWQQITATFEFTSDGLIIGKSTSAIKGIFDNQSLYFEDSEHRKMAWVNATDGLGGTQLSLGDPNTISNRWRIAVSPDGDHLRITRHTASEES